MPLTYSVIEPKLLESKVRRHWISIMSKKYIIRYLVSKLRRANFQRVYDMFPFSLVLYRVNSICKCNSIRWHERQGAVASLPFVPARKRGTDETLHTAYRASTLLDLRPDESRTYTNGDSRLDRRA